MRHLGVVGRVPVHGVHTQPVRHIHRPVLRHHQAATVLEEEAVQEAGVAHDTRRVARLAGHHVRPAVRMVSMTCGRTRVRTHVRAVPWRARVSPETTRIGYNLKSGPARWNRCFGRLFFRNHGPQNKNTCFYAGHTPHFI